MGKDKIRVLFVSPRGGVEAGGIAKWTGNILEYYSTIQDVSQIELVHCYNSKSLTTFGSEGLIKRIMKGFRNYLPMVKAAVRELKSGNYDCVHLCTSASLGLLRDLVLTSYAHRHNARVVVHFHFGRIPQILKSSGWEHRLLERLLNKVDYSIVMDKFSYKALQANGYQNIKYIPNPLSLGVQKIIDENKSISRIPVKLVFVGQMLKTKGISELAEATSTIPGIKVEYIGYMPESDFSESFKSKLDSSKYILTGSVPAEKVITEMLSAAMFVLPTYTEGFPNVIIESMACGCPIITCPVGAIPEMLNTESDEPCGICVPSQNVEKLREAIEYVLEHPSEAAIMGERARQRVYAEYSVDKVWKELAEVWSA